MCSKGARVADSIPDLHPPVPLTLEGSSVLHQFFRFDWKAWKSCAEGERESILARAVETLQKLERKDANAPVRSALYSLLGHKGDLMLIHFRDSLEELNQVELALAQTPLYDFLELRHSYVSVVELGLYESPRKTYEAATAKGSRHIPRSGMRRLRHRSSARGSDEAAAVACDSRSEVSVLLSDGPQTRRAVNWYTVPFAERQRMMHEHGMIGRRYAGR